MLMKLLVNVYERARSKLRSTHSSSKISLDSDVEINNFDSNYNKQVPSFGPLIIQQQQPRSSLSKWLCTTPSAGDQSIFSSKSNKVRRSSSWRSLKERGNNYINSKTLSVDELHRKHHTTRRRDISHSPVGSLIHQHRKLSDCNNCRNHARFDRLSSTFVNYPDKNKNFSRKSHRRNNRKQFEQQVFSTLSRHSGGGDSGYSEESFITKSCRRPIHTSCSQCHCEQRSSFNNYKKARNHSSTESSPSDITINKKPSDFDYHISSIKQNLLSSQSYPHIKPLPKISLQSQQRITRTLTDKRRRNLSCDGSLWARTQRSVTLTSSPVLSEPNHLPLQRHFTTIGMTHCQPSKNLSTNPNVFGELNLAAIELDSLRTSFSSLYSSSSSSSSSSSLSSINKDKHSKKRHHHHRKRTFLVWHEYKNPLLLSTTNGAKTFSVIRGDQVRLLKRIGKSTLLVQKDDDGSIGFLPQACLAQHQINSFLSLKGLRETVL